MISKIETNILSMLLNNQILIENWFKKQWDKHPPLLTGSVDLRYCGFKLSPVDTNVFPAGFNNLDSNVYPLCIHALKTTLTQYHRECKKILLIPESHTRNIFYFENLQVLSELIHQAGYDVKIGSLAPLKHTKKINLANDKILHIEPLIRNNAILSVENFTPEIIILNNDLSEGMPNILLNITQPIIPNLNMGWFVRRKTNHFRIYETLANELCALINIDPWFINPLFTYQDNISFLNLKNNHALEDELLTKVAVLLKDIQTKYMQYNIKEKPFVVIKSDSGTYGMAVMMIDNPHTILTLNRKQRIAMSVGKGKQIVSNLIIQEGVPTIDSINNFTCEPVIYTLGQTVVGGFNRVHPNKSAIENLNSPGMHFVPLQNIEYAHSVIARIAHLAASLESEQGVNLHV